MQAYRSRRPERFTRYLRGCLLTVVCGVLQREGAHSHYPSFCSGQAGVGGAGYVGETGHGKGSILAWGANEVGMSYFSIEWFCLCRVMWKGLSWNSDQW
jgi:hypothetical protein